MITEKRKIKELHPAEYNPRKKLKKGDIEYEKIKESIVKFGCVDPIIINSDGTIIGGHQRYTVLCDLGYKEIECVVVNLDKNDEKALNIALNKITGAWDDDALKSIFQELSLEDYDLKLTGFDSDEIGEILANELELEESFCEDDVPELTMQSITKEGDVWQLGEHRLMCGDATSLTAVEKLLEGNKVDLVFTDPPYGMKKEKDGVANDNLNRKDLLEFNQQWIALTFVFLKDNGSWYCWGIDEPLMDIYSNILKPMIESQKISFRNLITWDKGSGQGQRSDKCRMYATADEKCLFVMNGIQRLNNNSENYNEENESIRIYLKNEADKVGLTAAKLKDICGVSMYSHWFSKSQWNLIPKKHYNELQEYYKGAFEKQYSELEKGRDLLKEHFYEQRAYFDNTHDNMNSVWHFERTSQHERESTGGHATPKPLALCRRAIKTSTCEGGCVLDVFGGSGSTLIACEQLHRKAYVMELEPRWCDVIIKRWESITGEKAVRISNE